MLFPVRQAQEKRQALREALTSNTLIRAPGAFNPLCAMLIERHGFESVYISGAVLSADLGLPDIGLTTLSEVVGRAHQIARVTALPAIVDADTGFGEPMNAARTIQSLENAGLCGCHIEDQVNPKRCGHLDNKELVDTPTMVRRIKAAADARQDPNFLLIARTDARATEGLEGAIGRAKAYVDAGADMIFPEALADETEFEAFRKGISIPLLANMTEFGKSKLLGVKTLTSLGINMVIYPVTTLRLAMKAAQDGLTTLATEGSQASFVEKMQTRKELYALLGYENYNKFDDQLFNFLL